MGERSETIGATATDGAGQSFYYQFVGGGKSNVAGSGSCSSVSSAEEGVHAGEGSVPSSSSSSSSPGSSAVGGKRAGEGGGKGQHGGPVCKNCLTSTTPLWRRDEKGAVLCNACGLFLKLHGRPRPISLKTDVIKSRNRKGAHHQHQHSQSSESGAMVEPQHRRTGSEDKKRKQQSNGEVKSVKKAKTSEDSDMCSAANTLETLMSGDSAKPRIKPKLKHESPNQVMSPSQTATQLPHLSALLENVRSNSTGAQTMADQMSDKSTVSSPKIFAQGHQVGKQLPLQMSSMSEVAKPVHSNVPVSQSSSSTSLVRGGSLPQRYASPPQGLPSSVPSVQSNSALPVSTTQFGSLSEPARSLYAEQNPLTLLYKNEEEVIKLKTRINELELVTDLYKRHIFDLDERCRGLQMEIQSLKR